MKVTNQKPAVLQPVFHDNCNKDFEPLELLKSMVATPLFQPMAVNSPVTITNNGIDVTEDDVTQLIADCCGTQTNVNAEKSTKALLRQTLVHYDDKTNIGVAELFVSQSACASKLPEPSNKVVYLPAQDVIPTARQFLGGQCDYDMYFASLAYYARPATLGFYFANETCFDDFKTWLASQMTMLSVGVPYDTTKLMSDFQTLTLNGLTESLILRTDDSQNCEPQSFARLIVEQLMMYTNIVSPAEYGVLPFNVGELICPKTIVFVNTEKHSRATAREVSEEWKLINGAIQNKPNMVSNKKLAKLTALPRALQKAQNLAAYSGAKGGGIARGSVIRFSKKMPTTVNMARIIKRIIDKMAFVNKSLNTFKSTKMSFGRPNRRDPDDFNKQGKLSSTHYKPDIHLYIDTSGSISEEDYEDAVKACIKMAKTMNINMYFNSFSHCMSQTSKLHMKDKSPAAIYREFKKIPTVGGGTDYEQIWHFINGSKKRTREMSIIISDFEYYAPSQYIRHPKNLYYIPCSNQNYNDITNAAKAFAESMLHNDPNIRKHILF